MKVLLYIFCCTAILTLAAAQNCDDYSVNCTSGPSVACNLNYPDLGPESPHLSVGLMRDGKACYASITQLSSDDCSKLEIKLESFNAAFIEFSGRDGIVEVSLVGPGYGQINDECDIRVEVEVTSEATPVPDPDTTSEATPVPDPGTTSEATPVPDPDTTSEATPVPDPDTTSEATPVPNPDTTSEATPVPNPDTTSEATASDVGLAPSLGVFALAVILQLCTSVV